MIITLQLHHRPELIKPGIFSTQYYQFTLTIKEINKSVVRKLTDFEWFYHKLISFYPGIVVSTILYTLDSSFTREKGL